MSASRSSRTTTSAATPLIRLHMGHTVTHRGCCRPLALALALALAAIAADVGV